MFLAMNVNIESPEPITMPVYPNPAGMEANYPKAEEDVPMISVVDGIAQLVARAGGANFKLKFELGTLNLKPTALRPLIQRWILLNLEFRFASLARTTPQEASSLSQPKPPIAVRTGNTIPTDSRPR